MFFLFADDTNILYADKNLRSLELIVNQELCKLYDWLTANKVTLNVKKTNFVIFSPAQRKFTHLPKIKIFDNEQNKSVALECKEIVKYLGILIDNNLSGKHHTDHIVIKISRTIGLISKLRHFVPKHTLINIYRSLIAPYLSYGLIVWGQACKSYLDKLLKLQKRVLRFIYFSDHNQHVIPLFSDAGILPLQFSYYELTANLMFDIRRRNAPRNIRDLFEDISNIHSYNTRSSASKNFYIQSSRLSIQLNSFSRIGTTIWNEMPLTLRNLSKNNFKRKIKRKVFDILTSDDSYLDIGNIIQKVKFS